MAGKWKGSKPGLRRGQQGQKVRDAASAKLGKLRGKEKTALKEPKAFDAVIRIAKRKKDKTDG